MSTSGSTHIVASVKGQSAEVHERKQLISRIAELTREIERLAEDNRQLSAAVTIYRELVRRSVANGPSVLSNCA